MRNLTRTIAAVSMMAPASAYPLGIGDIKLHSALNQNLDAEIALVLSPNEKISEVVVSLAPPEKFDEAGVPWSYYLSKIKFDSITKSDGSTVVKLSSQEALREPFLDFLLEVKWAKGSLYREFTVLIDPPTAYTQSVMPVVQKAKQVSNVTQKVNNVVEPNSEIAESFSNYGPTTSRDTLWKVADKVNTYSDVSIEQMMIAIYKENPQAFYKDNVNALKADASLQIPEKDVILKLSQKKALAEFKKQNKVWKGNSVVATQVNDAVHVADKPTINTQLELEAPAEAEINDKIVVTQANAVIDETIKSGSNDKSPLSIEENSKVQTRLNKLEQQLEMMQKMLVLKDEQIAALQSSEVKKPIAEGDKTEQQPIKEANQVINTVVPEAKLKPEPKISAVKEVIQPKAKPKPLAKPVVQPEPEAGFMSDSMSLIIAGAGAVIISLLGLLWWRKREDDSESDGESMFATASEISLPDSSEEVLIPTVEDPAAYDVGTVGESSFLSEFTPSDFDAFDSDQNEVDPISEADVYLAYGRYQQAEDLMRQAISEQPDRDECKLKLLEIFYANENKESFEVFSTELVNAEKNNDQEFWSKVVEMGAELIPESSLFTGGETTKVSFEPEAQAEENEASSMLNQDLGSFDGSEIDNSSDTTSASVDFDLSVFDEEEKPSDKNIEDSQDQGVDFDLSAFDVDEKVEAEEDNTESNAEQAIETMDFDFDSSADESDSANEVETIEEIDSVADNLSLESNDEKTDGIDLTSVTELNAEDEGVDLSGFSVESLDSGAAETENVEAELPKETEIFDEFDFDSDTSSNASQAIDEIDLGVSDLTDMDELETKIDLAKAYIDMGDIDAAKGIAEEVKTKGNSEQKEAAQEIIDQLNS